MAASVKWSRGKVDFVKNNFETMSQRQIAEHFGFTPATVRRQYRVLGLKVTPEMKEHFRRQALRARTSFTKEEDDFIKKNYLTMPIKAMAKRIGRSSCGVKGRLNHLGLSVPAEVAERNRLAGLKHGQGWNKGMKIEEFMTSEQSIRNTLKTRYKKGNIPHNVREDYALSIHANGYLWIRKGMNDWELLQRWIYRIHHEVNLTSKENIIFKDGNRANFRIENLEKISNEDLMRRNGIYNRYPKNMMEAMLTLGRLKRLIKRYEK